jgi:hypothetical protein
VERKKWVYFPMPREWTLAGEDWQLKLQSRGPTRLSMGIDLIVELEELSQPFSAIRSLDLDWHNNASDLRQADRCGS